MEDSRNARQPMLVGAPRSGGGDCHGRVSFLGLFRFATAQDWALLAVATLAAVVQGGIQPAVGFFIKDLFEGIFEPNDNGTFPPTAGPHAKRDEKVRHGVLLFIALSALAFVMTSIAYTGFARVSGRMLVKLRYRFFQQLLRKDIGWYDAHGAADMASRLTNDAYDFREGTGEQFAQLIIGVVNCPCGFAVAFTRDWRLTLVMLVALPVMAAGMGLAMRAMATSNSLQQESYAKAGGLAETAISSIRTVAAFNGFRHELQRYELTVRDAERSGTRTGLCNSLSLGIAQLTVYATYALGFFVGSLLVVRDYNSGCWESDPPYGTCFTGATMISTLFSVMIGSVGLSRTAMPLSAATAAKAAAARSYALIDEPLAFDPHAGERPANVQGHVEFCSVTFFYPTRPEKAALEDASFKVPAGTTAAFIGPSGSGKSTMIALLERFYDASSGAVLFDGRDIRSLSLHWLRGRMAMVQQEPVLFSGTIFENISYGALEEAASEQQVRAAAKVANAHGFIEGFPESFQTQVGERGVQLSGGQKQRVAIARAMVREPSVLLLDEATSALDSESERVVQEALDKLMAQRARTTLVIAHRLSTVRGADEIFVLDQGHIVERGSHSALLSRPGSLYAQLLHLQQVSGVDSTAALIRQVTPPGRSNMVSEPLHGPGGLRPGGHEASGDSNRRAHACKPPEGVGGADRHGQPSAAARPAVAEEEGDVAAPMRRLWTIQKGDRGFVFLALLASIPAGAGRPLIGRLFSNAANHFSLPPAVNIAGQWIGIMDTDELRRITNKQCFEFILAGLIMCVATVAQIACFRRASEALTRKVRLLSFQAILRQEMGWFDARSSGQLADRLASEAPLIRACTAEGLGGALQVVINVTTGLCLAWYACWQLALCAAVFIPILAFSTGKAIKLLRKKERAKAGPLVSEAMGNMRTVAAFGLDVRILERYEVLLLSESRLQLQGAQLMGFMAAFNDASFFLLFGAVIYAANIFISHGSMHPDAVMQVLFPILFASMGVAQTTQWQADRTKAVTAVRHFFKTLDRVPLIDAYSEGGLRPEAVSGALEFRHVSFRYPSRPDVPVFSGFDLSVKANSTVALCGPSGSGKSTTIALLQRFYDADAGSVCLDGNDLRSLNLPWLRAQMALVQQEPVLFAGSVSENISYGREGVSQERCAEAARVANAHGFITGFPEGYATQVGERGAQLSGGQKQRIAIARAVARRPAVLLLDEATSALDSESERVVQAALDTLMAQKARTTLVIAHRLSTIAGADLICVVFEGRIVEKGTHDELQRIPNGHYKQLASRQHATC